MEIDKNGIYIPYEELGIIVGIYNSFCKFNLPISCKMLLNCLSGEKVLDYSKKCLNIRDSLNSHYEILKIINKMSN